MADTYPLMFTGSDREEFGRWLARCRQLGAASSMAAAIRLAVQLAAAATDEQIRQEGNAQ